MLTSPHNLSYFHKIFLKSAIQKAITRRAFDLRDTRAHSSNFTLMKLYSALLKRIELYEEKTLGTFQLTIKEEKSNEKTTKVSYY